MKTKLRIVSATVHKKSNEIEVIIEETKVTDVKKDVNLRAVWLDAEQIASLNLRGI